MTLDKNRIEELRQKAARRGLDPNQLNSAITQYQQMGGFQVPSPMAIPSSTLPSQSGYRPPTPNQSVTNQPSLNQTQKDVLSRGGLAQAPTGEKDRGFVGNFISTLVTPGINYIKFLGETGAQTVRAIDRPDMFKTGQMDEKIKELQSQSQQLIKQARATTDKTEKKRLLDQSRQIDSQIASLGSKAGEVGDMQKTFILDEEKIADRGKILETGARATAGAASYFVPGGTGFKGALKAGAVIGALNTASQDDTDMIDIATGAVTGAVLGGAFSVAGKGLKWALGDKVKTIKTNLLTKIGNNLREDATQIRVKPSVYGARKEKLIQETLDALGIVGGPQEKYEQLQPALQSLGRQIDDVLSENPNAVIDVAKLAQAFKGKLKSEIRNKTLTSKAAQNEINGYLTDLLKEVDPNFVSGKSIVGSNAALNSKVPIKQMYNLKKIINRDYGTIVNKLENNTPLNDREKVVFYARQVLDEAIIKTAPKVKQLTLMQSHLYDAARPLASARNTTPTFRVLGITIPKHRVLQDALGRGFVTTGQKLDDLMSKWVDPVTGKLKDGYRSIPQADQAMLQDVVSRLSIIAATSENDTEESSYDEQYGGDSIDNQGQENYQTSNIQNNQFNPPLNNIPQAVPSPMNPFGSLSKRQVISLALSQGASMSDVKEISELYDLVGTEDLQTITSETMTVANSLRQEYFTRTQQNGFLDITNAFNKIKNAPNTPAGDVSIVFAYMKLLDPGSVVREGEFATAENTAGIPDRLRNQYNKALEGKRLSDKQRLDFINSANSVYQQYQNSQAQIDALYQGLASQYGIDPSLVGIGIYGQQPQATQFVQTQDQKKKTDEPVNERSQAPQLENKALANIGNWTSKVGKQVSSIIESTASEIERIQSADPATLTDGELLFVPYDKLSKDQQMRQIEAGLQFVGQTGPMQSLPRSLKTMPVAQGKSFYDFLKALDSIGSADVGTLEDGMAAIAEVGNKAPVGALKTKINSAVGVLDDLKINTNAEKLQTLANRMQKVLDYMLEIDFMPKDLKTTTEEIPKLITPKSAPTTTKSSNILNMVKNKPIK